MYNDFEGQSYSSPLKSVAEQKWRGTVERIMKGMQAPTGRNIGNGEIRHTIASQFSSDFNKHGFNILIEVWQYLVFSDGNGMLRAHYDTIISVRKKAGAGESIDVSIGIRKRKNGDPAIPIGWDSRITMTLDSAAKLRTSEQVQLICQSIHNLGELNGAI
jgi:hypothetical protein